MTDFNIKDTFLKLTQKTLSHGDEDELLEYLPKNLKKDMIGNYFLRIGKSRTLFTAHLDDASWGNSEPVKHVIKDNYIETDGSTILGADDRAGVTVLLYMIHNNIPGTYYFFIGEESGMVGSRGISRTKTDWFETNFDRCVSFDRRGYGSIISNQIGQDCCSPEFVSALSTEFEKCNMIYNDDQGGIFTDSAAFIKIIPECTNLSVGYFNEHSNREYQDIEYLEQLCNATLKINWETLPTVGVKNKDNRNYWY